MPIVLIGYEHELCIGVSIRSTWNILIRGQQVSDKFEELRKVISASLLGRYGIVLRYNR